MTRNIYPKAIYLPTLPFLRNKRKILFGGEGEEILCLLSSDLHTGYILPIFGYQGIKPILRSKLAEELSPICWDYPIASWLELN